MQSIDFGVNAHVTYIMGVFGPSLKACYYIKKKIIINVADVYMLLEVCCGRYSSQFSVLSILGE